MGNLYDEDVIAWAEQQARLLRSGQWARLDIDNIAEEIEDVGKSEKRELQSRLAVLIAHLLKWTYQPGRRGSSWQNTIREQRATIADDLQKCPSLKPLLCDAKWLHQAYRRGMIEASGEARLPRLPQALPWPVSDLLSQDFLPE